MSGTVFTAEEIRGQRLDLRVLNGRRLQHDLKPYTLAQYQAFLRTNRMKPVGIPVYPLPIKQKPMGIPQTKKGKRK